MKRVITQITSCCDENNIYIHALCNDGTIMYQRNNGEWWVIEQGPVPQPSNETEQALEGKDD